MEKNIVKQKGVSEFYKIFKECQQELDIAQFEADHFGKEKPDPIKVVDDYFKNNDIVIIGGKDD